MPDWILGPIDHRSEVWNTYPVQRIVIEASAEWEAREKVAEVAADVPQPSPWLDPALTTCDEIATPDAVLASVRRRRRAPELPFHL
jgi:hypothetical protein